MAFKFNLNYFKFVHALRIHNIIRDNNRTACYFIFRDNHKELKEQLNINDE